MRRYPHAQQQVASGTADIRDEYQVGDPRSDLVIGGCLAEGCGTQKFETQQSRRHPYGDCRDVHEKVSIVQVGSMWF